MNATELGSRPASEHPSAITDAMVEAALSNKAWREDGAVWPDAYSEEEQRDEREAMREDLHYAVSVLAVYEISESMIDAAMPHLVGVSGSKIRPIGTFPSGMTAAEAEDFNWTYFGRDRVRAALAAAGMTAILAREAQEAGDD